MQPVMEPTASAAAAARAMSLVFMWVILPNGKTTPRRHNRYAPRRQLTTTKAAVLPKNTGNALARRRKQRRPEAHRDWTQPRGGPGPDAQMLIGVIFVPSRLTSAIRPPLVMHVADDGLLRGCRVDSGARAHVEHRHRCVGTDRPPLARPELGERLVGHEQQEDGLRFGAGEQADRSGRGAVVLGGTTHAQGALAVGAADDEAR